MQRTVLRYDRSKDRTNDLVLVVCSLLMGLISLRHFHSYYPDLGVKTWLFFITTAWFFGFAIAWFLKVADIGFLARKWNRISLSLDDEGLTYDPGGMRSPRCWPWAELSEIELVGPSLLRRRSSILFRPGFPGLLEKMTMESRASGPRMRLEDIFDAPIDQITAKMNEYRERALGNHGAGRPRSTHAGSDQT